MSDVIKELGLKPHLQSVSAGGHSITAREAVFVDDLRAAIEKLPVVYGFKDAPHFSGWHDMDNFPNKNPSHQARLICVEKLVKEPIKIQFESTVTNHGAQFYDSNKMTELRGKRVRVTVEEVIE